MLELAVDYYLNNLTESEIDPTTVALTVIILSQNTIMLQDESLRVMLSTFYFKQDNYTV